jgi:hypothetical protein
MDSLVTIGAMILAAAVLAAGVVWLGFKIPARPLLPDLGTQPEEVERIQPAPDVPELLQRWLRAGGEPRIPSPRSVVAYGRGRFRIARLPLLGNVWAPVAWTLHLVPGQAFVWRMRIYWFRRLIVDGGDMYRDGRGQFIFGHEPLASEYLDRSERLALWLYSIAFAPAVLLSLPESAFQALDESSLQVSIPAEEGPMEFTLRFDSASGALIRVETRRPAIKDGRLFLFQLALERYQPTDYGIRLPARLRPGWDEETSACYDLDGLYYNAPVARVLQEGVE